MPAGEALEDDYIISLLKKDADEHRKRYSLVGDGPLLSTAKRRPDAPKPNTRFLKNIIRETDSHNAALKAKEQEESRTRLRGLRGHESSGKRKRVDDDGRGSEGKKRKERESRPGRWASALGLDGERNRKPERERRAAGGKWRQSIVDGERSTHDRGTHRQGHRHERSHGERSERKHESTQRRDRSCSQERARPPDDRKEHRRRPRSPSRTESPADSRGKANESDSDPLTDFLGPKPPAKPAPRGRGALKPSNMDARFQDDYDPTSDVVLHLDEEDDWDMALEALKARTKWRAQGADRLRAAGFTEGEVERWEKSGSGVDRGGEKDVEDVRWRKQGEGREWDRGKVIDSNREGGVNVKAE